MKAKALGLLVVILVSGSCVSMKRSVREKLRDEMVYRTAIENAIYPEVSKVDTNLVPVTRQNPNLVWKSIDGQDYVLVVAWKQSISYYQPYLDSAFYNTGAYPIWVTTAPNCSKE